MVEEFGHGAEGQTGGDVEEGGSGGDVGDGAVGRDRTRDAMDVEVMNSVAAGEPTAALRELATQDDFTKRIHRMRAAIHALQHAVGALDGQLKNLNAQLVKEKKALDWLERTYGGATLEQRYQRRMAYLGEWRVKGAVYRDADEGRAAGISRRIERAAEELRQANSRVDDARRHIIECSDVSAACRRILEAAVESHVEAVGEASGRLAGIEQEWNAPVKCGLSNRYVPFVERLERHRAEERRISAAFEDAESSLGEPLRRLLAARDRVEDLQVKVHSCNFLPSNNDDVKTPSESKCCQDTSSTSGQLSMFLGNSARSGLSTGQAYTYEPRQHRHAYAERNVATDLF